MAQTAFAKRRALIKEIRAKMRRRRPRRQPRPVRPFRRATLRPPVKTPALDRARTATGTYKGDDPSTPEVNEERP